MEIENKELSEYHKNLEGMDDYEYHEGSMWLLLF